MEDLGVSVHLPDGSNIDGIKKSAEAQSAQKAGERGWERGSVAR